MYGTSKLGTRHLMPPHPPSHHSNANYNVGSYGYDNYAIDDDMLMLDEDDLDDRLYDMDAVWADHDHEKHKIPPNSTGKKVSVDRYK